MSSNLTFSGFLAIAFSVLIALLLSIAPLPSWLGLFRPPWLLLIVIYWVIKSPNHVSLGIAWLLGLLLDALYGSVLGQHALALSVSAYIAEKFYRQFRLFPMLQQALSVAFLVIIYQALLLWVQGVLGQLALNGYEFWLSVLGSLLIWPFLYMLLQALRRRLRMY